MQIEAVLAKSSPNRDTALTIGVFDGVHLGHQYLLSQLTELARQQNLLSAVITFDPPPQKVLSPRTKLQFLTKLDQRLNLLKDEGVDIVSVLPFTRELSRLSARQFTSLLGKYLRMKRLVVSSDFTLGKDREGTTRRLLSLGSEMGFVVSLVSPLMIDGEVVSSTTIRNTLANGDLKRVRYLIGRPFSLCGWVIPGVNRGTRLGFPTANLDIGPEQALPADGVYATWAYIDNQAYQSVTNIGKSPTFASHQNTVEVHILDYHDNLYQEELRIDIIERLRGEKQFATTAELREQIAKDIKQGRLILGSGMGIKHG
ncbi:MAG: bifunctional riboflavin kinase/FAD synthetase [Dehalococcoidales bacterium]|nr:bifunctional riboflavin kinase/FAD synthetase [Dehalococcoidales bacterium]